MVTFLGVPMLLIRTFCTASSVRGAALVQGASRGLGLEFVKQLLETGSNEGNVVATCRNPSKAIELQHLRELHPSRLSILPLDVTDEITIQAAAKQVSEIYGGLDLLINTAGILHVDNVVKPETALSRLEANALMLTFQVNAVGPALVIKHMSPLLKASPQRSVAVVANLSARVGSIGDNKTGGWYSYRASKSALNQLTKSMSVEFARKREPPVSCILLHPGTVDTDLSKPYQRNVPREKLFTKEFSVNKMLDIINRVGLQDNGKFFAWDGSEIVW